MPWCDGQTLRRLAAARHRASLRFESAADHNPNAAGRQGRFDPLVQASRFREARRSLGPCTDRSGGRPGGAVSSRGSSGRRKAPPRVGRRGPDACPGAPWRSFASDWPYSVSVSLCCPCQALAGPRGLAQAHQESFRYFLISSRGASRGSTTSSPQSHSMRFRLAPQVGQRPLHPVRQTGFCGRFR